MDPRIDVHRIFQINPADVFVLKNAGNIYTQDMMRSVILSIIEYKIKYIIVLGHLDCGMTKLNLKMLREKLPSEFLKTFSRNYSEVLLELHSFFKPFNNEIRNVIEQINDLNKIRKFFPDVEITGMLYDVQTGWIFKGEDFKDLLRSQNDQKNYKALLYEKNQKLAKFLEENTKIYQNTKESVDKIQVNELELQEEITSVINETDELKNSGEDQSTKFQLKMPKFQFPKIIIPKINIYRPKINEIIKRKKNL